MFILFSLSEWVHKAMAMNDTLIIQLLDWQTIVSSVACSIRKGQKFSTQSLSTQSICLREEQGGESLVYRNIKCRGKKLVRSASPRWTLHAASPKKLPHRSAPGANLVRSPSRPAAVDTLHDSFQYAVHTWPYRKFLLEKDSETGQYSRVTTYAQADERVTRIASGLVQLGMRSHESVGVYCNNSAEWVLLELGAWLHSLVIVPLYDSLELQTVHYCIDHSEVACVACSHDNFSRLVEALHGCLLVKYVILLDGGIDDLELPESSDVELIEALREKSAVATEALLEIEGRRIRVLTLAGLEHEGNSVHVVHRHPRPRDLATVLYTASPSGRFHGAMLTHGNYMASVAGLLRNGVEFSERDVHVSYLPMAHVYERLLQCCMIYSGGSIGFAHKNDLFSDVAALKPTLFVGVPRLYNRLYGIVMDGVVSMSWFFRLLFRFAYYNKQVYLHYGLMRAGLWDYLVFSRVRRTLGGRVRLMASGSAPISPEVLTFLRMYNKKELPLLLLYLRRANVTSCFSCEVLEGYGQTETCGSTSITLIGDYQTGHVGPPSPCCEIKLVDVPDMQYTSHDQPYPRGEICVRGANVFVGYLKNPRKTEKVLGSNGWLKSGDLGAFRRNGTLMVLNQRKSMFKLAQGEYIMPLKIEAVYARSRFVRQIFISGNPLSRFIVAIVVVRHSVVLEWARTHLSLSEESSAIPDLCKHHSVVAAVLQDMQQVAASSGLLRSFEMVAAISLRSEEFSEAVYDSARQKVRRHAAKKAFQHEIEQLYAFLAPANFT